MLLYANITIINSWLVNQSIMNKLKKIKSMIGKVAELGTYTVLGLVICCSAIRFRNYERKL